MAKILIILLVGLAFEAVGVVYLSKGMKQIGDVSMASPAEILRVIRAGATNPNILLGVFFEALFFAGLLVLLSKSDVSLIWPLTSLSFVFTGLAARFFLHEEISPARWMGILLIVAGAALVSWSERQKERNRILAAANPAAVSSRLPE